MNPYILATQLICQFSWGVYCLLHSPHNIILSFLNLSLLIISTVSSATGDEELLFQRAYIATWVIPAAIVVFSQLAGIGEMQNFTLVQAGVAPVAPPIEGSSAAYSIALHNYFIAQLIIPIFRVANWLFRLL